MAENSIQNISEMFKPSSSTLRYYEETGMLMNIARTNSRQRMYNDSHLNGIRIIGCFKDTGVIIVHL